MISTERARVQMAAVIVETTAKRRPRAMAQFEDAFLAAADLIRVPRKPAADPLNILVEAFSDFEMPKSQTKLLADYLKRYGGEMFKDSTEEDIADAMLEIVQCTHEAWFFLDPDGYLKARAAAGAV